MNRFTWDTAGPRERGMWVRDHLKVCRYDIRRLCDLFELTEAGAERILAGEDWQPEFERPAVNYI